MNNFRVAIPERCSCSHFDNRDLNVDFSISAIGRSFYKQTVGHGASIVPFIG